MSPPASCRSGTLSPPKLPDGDEAPSSRDGVTRRRALGAWAAAAAALAALPTQALASAPLDPVLIAMSRHRAARALLETLCRAIDEVAADRAGRKVGPSDEEAYEKARLWVDNALEDMLATPPSSAAGMRVAIAYLLTFEDESLSDYARPFLASLLLSPVLESERRTALISRHSFPSQEGRI